MSQSLRTPKGIALRAVAAAALYATRRDLQVTDETKETTARDGAQKDRILIARKPKPKI